MCEAKDSIKETGCICDLTDKTIVYCCNCGGHYLLKLGEALRPRGIPLLELGEALRARGIL